MRALRVSLSLFVGTLPVAAVFWVGACDEKPAAPVIPSASASAAAPEPPPPREGCSRTGSIQAIENDPACAFHPVLEDVMRASMKRIAITSVVEPPEVVAGASANITITIANTTDTETLVVLETRTRAPGARTDWARIAGMPEARQFEGTHVFFATTTVDLHNHDVDALPTLADQPAPPAPQAIGIHLRPHGKLTHTFSWWALRIPAPAPIVKDDAGHRFVPKTSALALERGEYSVVVDVPLFALSPEERKLATRIKVIRLPPLDGGK